MLSRVRVQKSGIAALVVSLAASSCLALAASASSSTGRLGDTRARVAETRIPPDFACERGIVNLTFDDGPGPFTEDVLDVLRRENVQATFFVLGRKVTARPELARRIVADGHAVGNHSWDHPELTKRPNRSVGRQIRLTNEAITKATGRTVHLFRPPFGDIDARVQKHVTKNGLRTVLWTVDPRDWDGRSAASIAKRAVKHLEPHGENIVLLHDDVTTSARTLKALPDVITAIRAQGYCFAPLEPTGPRPTASLDSEVAVDEDAGVVLVKVTFDRPAEASGSVVVRTQGGTAVADRDFITGDQSFRFRRGARSVAISIPVLDDAMAEPGETFTIALTGAGFVVLPKTVVTVSVRDDDAAG